LVDGTLSIDPPDGSVVRLASVIAITVTVTLEAGVTLPSSAVATLQVTDGGELTTSSPQPFVQDPGNPKEAHAIFYVAIAPDAQRVTVVAGTAGFVNPPTPLNATYLPSLAAAMVLYSDPNPLWLPAAADDNQLPTNTACTAHYSAVVTDALDEPIADYIIEWGQIWDSAAFTNMRAFPSLTATEPLVPDFSNIFHKYGVVRTKTNENGVSDLYMVTTTQLVYFALEGDGRPDEPTPLQPIIVFGDLVDTQLAAPDPAIINFDLDNTVGPSVPVSIQTLPLNEWPSKQPIEVLLFVNQDGRAGLVGEKIVVFNDDLERPPYLVFDVSKVHFYTDHGAHANELNNVFYVRAVQAGNVGRSPPWQERLTGDNGGNQPDPGVTRVLDPPQVLYADPWINVRTVQNGLILAIPIHDYPGIWTPEQNDVITATIYLNGWDSQTGGINQNSFSQNFTLPDPSQLGGVDMLFPYDAVVGFDSSTDDPPASGAFYAEYYVVKHDDINDNRIYSKIYQNQLDTAAPGYTGT
jgi:hypothetical protein